MAREIRLQGGQIALVDDEDYEEVSAFKWYLTTRYAARCRSAKEKSEKRHISMHRQVMGDPSGCVVHHMNGNGLDNRRANLQVCTQRANMRYAHGIVPERYGFFRRPVSLVMDDETRRMLDWLVSKEGLKTSEVLRSLIRFGYKLRRANGQLPLL